MDHIFSKFMPYKELRLGFTQEPYKLTKYPVSNVSGKNTIVHNVKRRLHGC
jgi:hypothetical protein